MIDPGSLEILPRDAVGFHELRLPRVNTLRILLRYPRLCQRGPGLFDLLLAIARLFQIRLRSRLSQARLGLHQRCFRLCQRGPRLFQLTQVRLPVDAGQRLACLHGIPFVF